MRRSITVLVAAATPTLVAAQQPQWQHVVKSVSSAVVVVETEKGQGSGFFVRSDGTLVTNHHVVAAVKQVAVRTSAGEVFRGGFVMARDESRDLAILRVEGFDLPIIPLANSNSIEVGMPVLLLGAPRGLELSASEGIVAGTRTDDNGAKFIQTSAAASPGSSGGPLLNREGHAIGVLSFSLRQSQNLNFAVPSNYVHGILERLVAVAAQPEARLEPLPAKAERSAVPSSANTQVARARSRAEAFLSSKTIYVLTNDVRLRAGVTNELIRWGRYTQLALAEGADLVLRVELTHENAAGNGKAAAQLIDGQSMQVLWSGSRGGVFTDVQKVGRQIVEELRNTLQEIENPQSPKK